MFGLFRAKPKLTVKLPALIPPARPPALIEDRAAQRYDLEMLPPAAPPVLPPASQLKVTTHFRTFEESHATGRIEGGAQYRRDGESWEWEWQQQKTVHREIVVRFKNTSREDFQGGEFTFRVKEGRKVVRQSCHCSYRFGRGKDAYNEESYTYIGCLHPGEYEEHFLPGLFDPAVRQKVEITLL